MAAPKTENKAIDKQPNSGSNHAVQTKVTLSTFEALSHDPDNLGILRGTMNGDGSWSTVHIDHNGNQTAITHGANKAAAQASHRDVSGGHDVERVAGGSHSQKANGSNEENGEADTKSVDGPNIKGASASDKIYSKGGDGNFHHKGDMTMMVEEGGLHYSCAQDFTVAALGSLIKLTAQGDVAVESKGSNITATSPTQIKMTCGAAIIQMTPTMIKASVGGSYILIEGGKITIQAGRVDINP
jgi:hypothetical protein